MDFITFRNNVVVLDEGEGGELRNKYIQSFINTEHDMYQEQIQVRHEFLDGFCYLGYLWDYLKEPKIIENEYIDMLLEYVGEVYVFWDIHSCENIFIEDYWRFDKDAVLKLQLETLLKGECFLPEDIYIFDDSFRWTIIKTHEDFCDGLYWLKSGQI